MGTVTCSRKQRLRTLENEIREAAGRLQNNGLEIGLRLCEIRDEHLWKEDFSTWNQYLKQRGAALLGKSVSWSMQLIQAAEVSKRLPSVSLGETGPKVLQELARLAPNHDHPTVTNEKNYSRLREQDVSRVLAKATEFAGGKPPSVRDVRKAVDQDLGIDRAKKAKETIRERDAKLDLAEYVRRQTGQIEGMMMNFAEVPANAWTVLENDKPGLVERLATACDDLAELLRS